MSVQFSPSVINALQDASGSLKILATASLCGTPHIRLARYCPLDEEGNILYAEAFQSTQTNHDLEAGLLFSLEATIYVLVSERQMWQIVGTPVKKLVCGPVFRHFYDIARAEGGSGDIAAVWVIQPRSISDESWEARRRQVIAKQPFRQHLDQVLVAEESKPAS